MSKVKKVLRKKLAYTKRRQQSRRTRKLRGKTRNRNRKYNMRGGLNKVKLINLLAAFFSVAKVENPDMYKGQTVGLGQQLDYAIEHKNDLLVAAKDPESPMYTSTFPGVEYEVIQNLDLSSIIGDMNGKSLKELSTGEINVDDYKVDMSTDEF